MVEFGVMGWFLDRFRRVIVGPVRPGARVIDWPAIMFRSSVIGNSVNRSRFMTISLFVVG